MRMGMVVPFDRAVAVGAAFRIERGDERRHPAAEPGHQILDHVIAANAQGAGQKLGRQVAIAEMPGDAQQVVGRLRLDVDEILAGGEDRDDAAVRKQERVAVMQLHRARQVEQHLRAAGAVQHGAAAVPVFPVEHDAVGRRAFPAAGGEDFLHTDHAMASAPRFMAVASAGRDKTRSR